MAELIDLSHRIVSGRPGYPGLPAPRIEPYISHAASLTRYDGQAVFEITRLFLVGNTGTYLDSPYHRHPDGPDIAGLPLEAVAALPGIRLEAELASDGRSVVMGPATGRRIAALPDPKGRAVLVRSGWSARYGTPEYWQPGPHLSLALVDRLVTAGVALVGVDFWNVDDPADPARPVHTRLLGAGIPIVEHLQGLDRLPTSGFRFTAAPIAIEGAASLPVRAYAEVPG